MPTNLNIFPVSDISQAWAFAALCSIKTLCHSFSHYMYIVIATSQLYEIKHFAWVFKEVSD